MSFKKFTRFQGLSRLVDLDHGRMLRTLQWTYLVAAGTLNIKLFLEYGWTIDSAFGLATFVVVSVLVPFRRWGLNMDTALQLTTAAIILDLYISTVFTWHVSPTLAALILTCPPAMLLLFGTRAAAVWTAISVAMLLSVPYVNSLLTQVSGYLPSDAAKTDIENLLVLLFVSLTVIYMATTVVSKMIQNLISQKEQLEQAKREIEQAQTARNRFFASVSHEIRTPLNAIHGITALLQHHAPAQADGEHSELVQTLQNSSKHLLSLINDLLDLGKLEEGRLKLVNEPLVVRDLLASAMKIVDHAAQEKSLLLSCTVDPEVPDWVVSDWMRLKQCLLNLLSNAIKFTREGSVHVKCKRTELEGRAALEFSVLDTGPGVPEELQPHLFQEMYIQGQRQLAQHSQQEALVGTGLGLLITKRIVEQMQGAIGYDSVGGKGARFYFSVPLVLSQVSPQASQPQALAPDFAHHSLTMLIVDDNATNLVVARKLIEKHLPQVRIHEARHGQEAIEKLQSLHADNNKVEIILMDIFMPIMDGVEATKRIRAMAQADLAHIPILAMTANVSVEEVQDYYDIGMNDVVSKPFDIRDLLNRIERLISKKPPRGAP